MIIGTFYFIKNDYFKDYDPNQLLMQNKVGQHQRPCFYAFPDKQYPDIFWCVPFSSQVAKFEAIVNHKIAKMQERGISNPDCNTIRFGEVMGFRKAFLIQNMFPVTKNYISHQYIDPNTHNPVTVSPAVEKDIKKNARIVLKAVERGHKHLIFSDVLQTKQDLVTKEKLQKRETISQEKSTDKVSIKDQLAQAHKQAEDKEKDATSTQPKHNHSRT